MDFKKLLESMDRFAGEKVGQKPGDQVRGNEPMPKKGGDKHPFLKRLVGDSKKPKLRKYEQELAEAWAQFKEAAPIIPGAAPVAGQPVVPVAGAAPAVPPKPGQPAPVDPAAAAALKKSLTNLKTVLPGLDVTKATTTMAKADTGTQLSPTDQAIVGKIAPQLADVIKNPQLTTQLKTLIGKAGQQEVAAAKKAAQQPTQPTTATTGVQPQGLPK